MLAIQFLAAFVTLVFCAIIAIQSVTLGYARTSALIVAGAAMFVLVAANASWDGAFRGTHMLGLLTALFLPWWAFVRNHASDLLRSHD